MIEDTYSSWRYFKITTTVVLFNGSDKILRGSSPIGSYYLVTDKSRPQVITRGSVTNDFSAPMIPRIAPTYRLLLPSRWLSASLRGTLIVLRVRTTNWPIS